MFLKKTYTTPVTQAVLVQGYDIIIITQLEGCHCVSIAQLDVHKSVWLSTAKENLTVMNKDKKKH